LKEIIWNVDPDVYFSIVSIVLFVAGGKNKIDKIDVLAFYRGKVLKIWLYFFLVALISDLLSFSPYCLPIASCAF